MNYPVGISGNPVSGKLVRGSGKAEFFTGLSWVRAQCREKLGFVPFPGTLNLEIAPDDKERLEIMAGHEWKSFVPPHGNFCASRVLPVWIGPVKGAWIQPEVHGPVQGRRIMEILAPVRLREVLALKDGDRVEVGLGIGAKISSPLLTLDAVLFDLDGTLIDSVESYYRIVEIVLERLGLPAVSRERILKAAQKDTFQWEQILRAAPGKTLSETKAKARQIIEVVYPEFFLKHIRPFPHTGAVLRLLHACRIRMGIVTSTPQKNIRDKMNILDQAGVAGLVEVVISAEDAGRKKPHPDPLMLCQERMGLDANSCAYVGDTSMDIAAGRAAGMKTIGVLTGFDSRDDLLQQNPDHIIDSILDLPRALDLYGPPSIQKMKKKKDLP